MRTKLINNFETATRGSFRKMLVLIISHVVRLQKKIADADIQEIYDRTLPLKDDYITNYMKWDTAHDICEGKTLALKNLMRELNSEKFSRWEAFIKIQFPKRTSTYVGLFPDGSIPFQCGSYVMRTSHVGSLAQKLLLYPELSALQQEVAAYYIELKNIRNEQVQQKAAVIFASLELHEKRLAVAEMLYGNLGLLMNKHRGDIQHLEYYFKLSLFKKRKPKKAKTTPPHPLLRRKSLHDKPSPYDYPPKSTTNKIEVNQKKEDEDS